MTLRHCWAWQLLHFTGVFGKVEKRRLVDWWFNEHLPSGELTWQLKSPIFNRRYIFKRSIFCCHVSLPERNHLNGLSQTPLQLSVRHNTGHTKHRSPETWRARKHDKNFTIPTYSNLFTSPSSTTYISILRSLGKRSPAFSMSPANVNSEARREQKRAPREEPGTNDWIVTIKVVRRVNRKNTSSRFEQKGRACSGTLQQRYCLKLGVVCIPGLEGRGMMVIMLAFK